MNKTILKIYAILLLLIAGVINANSVVAFADETSEYVKVFEEHIKAKKSGKYESQDFKKEINVEETGVYTVTVDSPCESYGLSVYNMLDIVDDSNLLIYMTQAYKSQKVYLEKGKTYVLKCRVDYRNLDEFDFKATFKLTDKKEYKAELEVSILKEDSYDFDEMEKTSIKDANIKGVTYDASTRTLTLDNATIKGSIFARRVNPGFGYDYKSVDSDLNIVVKGDNKIVSNGLCGPEQIFTYDTNLNISGGGTLNFVAANTGIRTYDMKIENVTIKGDNFKLLSNKSEMKNLKFDVSVDYVVGMDMGEEPGVDYDYDLTYDGLFYEEDDYVNEVNLTDCVLDLRYNLVPKKFLKKGYLVGFCDHTASQFNNCTFNVTIQKELLKDYKNRYKKINKNNKVNYKTIKKSYRDYCAKGVYVYNSGIYGVYKVTKAASSDGKYIGSVELISVTDSSDYEGEITIPDSIKIGEFAEFKVVKVHKDAVSNRKKLKKLVIGKNVRTIGRNAFAGNKKLKYVKIKSANIKKIIKGTFTRKGGKKIKFVVPKKMVKKYKRLLKKSGVKKFTVVAA